MDFIIPNKTNPQVIIESSFVVITSSGQSDKSKTEGSIKALISKYYPNAKFIGFVDGIVALREYFVFCVSYFDKENFIWIKAFSKDLNEIKFYFFNKNKI